MVAADFTRTCYGNLTDLCNAVRGLSSPLHTAAVIVHAWDIAVCLTALPAGGAVVRSVTPALLRECATTLLQLFGQCNLLNEHDRANICRSALALLTKHARLRDAGVLAAVAAGDAAAQETAAREWLVPALLAVLYGSGSEDLRPQVACKLHLPLDDSIESLAHFRSPGKFCRCGFHTALLHMFAVVLERVHCLYSMNLNISTHFIRTYSLLQLVNSVGSLLDMGSILLRPSFIAFPACIMYVLSPHHPRMSPLWSTRLVYNN